MLYIFNQNEELIDILSNEDLDQPIITNDNFKRQVNQEWSYTFDININKLTEQNIKVKNKVGFYDENDNFQLFTIEKVEDNFGDKDIKSVICYHDFYTLVNKIIENLELTNATIDTTLTSILQDTNYQVGNVISLGTKDINIGYMSKLEALNDMLIAYGGEVGYRLTLNANKTGIGNRYVDIGRLGADTGIRFSFDLNITEIKRTVDTVNLFNVLYGRGKASDKEDEIGNRKITFSSVVWTTPTNPTNKPLGQTYVADSESITKWGRLEGVYHADDTEDKALLLQRTWEKLQEMKNPQITYEVSIVDLAKITGFEHLKVALGDTIFIYDTDYDINLEARIIEESYSIFDPTTKQIVLGNFLKGYTDNNTTGNLSNRLDILEDDIKSGSGVVIGDNSFPDTLPIAPTLTATGLFSTVQLDWTYENKPYYEYEIYSSKILNFTPDISNLIYRGKSSSYLHEVLPSETWYYVARAINTRGSVTAYSTQVSATTLKIADGTQYIGEQAIGHALIKDVNADRINVGKLKGQYIDAKNLTVTDGNAKETFKVDSVGNVKIDGNYVKLDPSGIGLKITHTNQGTTTIMDAEGFKIYNSNDEEVGSLANEFGLTVLQADEIYANNIFSTSMSTGNLIYYINGTTGNDSNDGLTSGTAKKTLRNVFDNLPKFKKGGSLTVNISGTVYEQYAIENFWWNGNFNIYFSKTSKMYGNLHFRNINHRVFVYGDKTSVTTLDGAVISNSKFNNSWDNTIACINCNLVAFIGINIHQYKSFYPVIVTNSNVYVEASDVYMDNLTSDLTLFRVTEGGTLGLLNTIGTGRYIYRGNTNAQIFISGGTYKPKGTLGTFSNWGGAIYTESGTLTATDSKMQPPENPLPPPPTTEVYEKVWATTGTKSWRDSGWRTDNSYIYQGEYGGNGNHKGFIIYNSADIRSNLSGATIHDCKITLKRRSSGGSSSAQSIHLYGHVYTATGGGTSLLKDYGVIGSLAWGETKTFDISNTVATDLKNGTIQGLAIYSSSGSPYVILEATANLTIKYEK